MREIKFRAWEHLPEGKGQMMSPNVTAVNCMDWMEDLCWILMQYTGLKDKNGVEIYEGDILTDEGALLVVGWDNGMWWANEVNSSKQSCQLQYLNPDVFFVAEVIGNIHENPELCQ